MQKKGTSHEVAQTLQGNQFVWVPVEVDKDFKIFEGYYNGSLASMLENCKEPYPGGYATEQAEYDAMRNSVLQYDGFYAGRYEAGVEGSARVDGDGIEDEVIIKQGKNVYNYVGWSNSDDMTNETGGAVEVAKRMYSRERGDSVTSTLIYGVQWDAIMQFIDSGYKNEDGKLTSYVADSTGKGNYDEDENTNSWRGRVTVTGSSENYAVKNIYDLAGNVAEWTKEAYSTYRRVIRGR